MQIHQYPIRQLLIPLFKLYGNRKNQSLHPLVENPQLLQPYLDDPLIEVGVVVLEGDLGR
jgi:hypothetical protein